GAEDHSLATPLDLVVSGDGSTLYVAAFGSGVVGVIPTAALEAGTFDPEVASAGYVPVTGGGPAGLALDDRRGVLFVYTRFDDGVSVVDTTLGQETAHLRLHSPEPAPIVDGRPVLYDARATSSNGEASCASCHVFGDLDQLAWDLGNPDDNVTQSPIQILLGIAGSVFPTPINGTGRVQDFHPMKGPMTTQTLRGLVNSGAQHWRGDRATGFFGTAAADSNLAFRNFIVAYSGLVGRATNITPAEMQQFADFALAITLPPNPNRRLDNSLTPSEQRGHDFYSGPRLADGAPGFGFTCEGCHRLDPASGFFGTGTKQSFENESQIIKVPHLRNLYQKVGMFGMPQVPFFEQLDSSFQGDQIRGFGFTHDGSTDTLFRFFHARVFSNNRSAGFDGGEAQRRDVEAFMMAFDSDLAPVVGQQVTLRSDNAAAAGPRIDLLIQRARTSFVSKILGGTSTECDLVAKVRVGDRVRGYFLDAQGRFVPDDKSPVLSDAELRQLARAEGSEVTYTAVPPGSGTRIGVDRDLDGQFDGGGSLTGPKPTGCSCQVGASPEAGRGVGLLAAGALVLTLALRRRSRRRLS
ncbi:MAG TPA: hypothetical protein VH877_18405, partial [Polyangia bacterium]|nr:hypothetical protein [Polyangia bacterium]